MVEGVSGVRFRDVVVLHRLHFPMPVMYLAYALWGVAFGAARPAELIGVPAVLVTFGNLLLLLAGLALNSAVDIAGDQRDHAKRHLADAALRIGGTRVHVWVIAEFAAGLMCVTIASVAAGRWLPLICAGATVLLQTLYNVEPVRLKRRGAVGAVAFGLAVPGLPALLSYSAVSTTLDPAVLCVFGGLTVMTIGRTAWWSVPDHHADEAVGIGTLAVRHGVGRAAGAAAIVMTAGAVCTEIALSLHFDAVRGFLALLPHWAAIGLVVRSLSSRRATGLRRPVAVRRWSVPLVTVAEVLVAAVPLTAM